MSEQRPTARFVQLACIWEASARKVGNVHPGASFHDLHYTDFVRAAELIAEPMDHCRERGVGQTVRAAAESVRFNFSSNPNLGIILLFAPIAAATGRNLPLRQGIERVLQELTVEDARFTYQAIRLTRPGGLGHAPEQDIRDEPTIDLRAAMTLSSERDLIARQYAEGFRDLFDFCLQTLLEVFEREQNVEAAVVECQLRMLARWPDSLIARKCGDEIAENVRRRAEKVVALGGIATPEGRRAGVELDRYLRSDGNRLNPGTTADLIAATLFIALLENKTNPDAPFAWRAADWL